MADSRICFVEGCGKGGRLKRGMCAKHYWRFRTHGDPNVCLVRVAEFGAPKKFFEEVIFNHQSDDCLIWPYSKTRGYAVMMRDGKMHRVPRLVCERLYGPAPTDEHEAAHSCGRGHEGCVSPRHLSWKSRKENAADKLLHGTAPRGERNGAAKLTAKHIIAIRAAAKHTPLTNKEIAEIHGLCRQSVDNIVARKSWKSVA